jgi:hypothetical protein
MSNIRDERLALLPFNHLNNWGLNVNQYQQPHQNHNCYFLAICANEVRQQLGDQYFL